ncbi:MAG: hypothetical protein WBQ75_01690 [Acetobacteraceae bacterium]
MLFIAATAAWRPSAEAARERQAAAIADLDARHRRDLPSDRTSRTELPSSSAISGPMSVALAKAFH